MNWYKSLRISSKPPSYVIERISDLLHASEVSKTSPGEAKSILARIMSQLEKHMDNEYLESLTVASNVVLDNPARARDLIALVAGQMQFDREKYLRKDLPWEKNWSK